MAGKGRGGAAPTYLATEYKTFQGSQQLGLEAVFGVWRRVSRADAFAVALADRHYSRQTFGAQLGRNCRTRVFQATSGPAIWVAVWPDAAMVKHGLGDCWECSLFRNEGAGLSSALIVEAVRATSVEWGAPPEGGYITTVDPRRVRPKRDPGRCFLRAGWERVGVTTRGYLWFRLARERVLEQLP